MGKKQTNRSGTKVNKSNKLKWVGEKKAAELILAGCKCINSFHSDRYGKTLFGFKETPKLTELLKTV